VWSIEVDPSESEPSESSELEPSESSESEPSESSESEPSESSELEPSEPSESRVGTGQLSPLVTFEVSTSESERTMFSPSTEMLVSLTVPLEMLLNRMPSRFDPSCWIQQL